MQRRWTTARRSHHALPLVMSACGGAGTGGTTVRRRPRRSRSCRACRYRGVAHTDGRDRELDPDGDRRHQDPERDRDFEGLGDATAAKGSWDAAQEAGSPQRPSRQDGRGLHRDVQLRRGEGLDPASQPGGHGHGLAAQHIPGLTKGPEKGAEAASRQILPERQAQLPRVVPADDNPGAVGATWAQELGAKKVSYIVHDTSLYGKGIADVFRAKAKALGLTEAG